MSFVVPTSLSLFSNSTRFTHSNQHDRRKGTFTSAVEANPKGLPGTRLRRFRPKPVEYQC